MASNAAGQRHNVQQRDAQLKARSAKRKGLSEARRAEAETHKEAGNVHFRAARYRKAIEEYNNAIIKHGPRCVYLSNIAAAWLKLGEYDAAEECASAALSCDPKSIKARYRCGLARKGNLQLAAAAVDFRTVLKQDPASTEAKSALEDTLALMRARNKEDAPGPKAEARLDADRSPSLNGDGMALESLSDSSDCQHTGNGKPCTRYNYDGCMRGARCKFSHAPDYVSVRDGLGRNVCLDFLLGLCTVSDAQCTYAHETTYLRSDGWWNNSGTRFMSRSIASRADNDEPPEWSLYRLMKQDGVFLWNSPGIVKVFEKVQGATKGASDGTPAYMLSPDWAPRSIGRGGELTHEEIQERAASLKKLGMPMAEAALESIFRALLPTS
ncbi:hypothetical protein BC834DRAFT_1042084 [Gloeopeniophorella convolvens]|nr:hypothetical protein BC834DRAFT_1042084 [Gloeopeniophorella convolvens]